MRSVIHRSARRAQSSHAARFSASLTIASPSAVSSSWNRRKPGTVLLSVAGEKLHTQRITVVH